MLKQTPANRSFNPVNSESDIEKVMNSQGEGIKFLHFSLQSHSLHIKYSMSDLKDNTSDFERSIPVSLNTN